MIPRKEWGSAITLLGHIDSMICSFFLHNRDMTRISHYSHKENMADLWEVSRCADIIGLSQQHLQVWSQPFSFHQHRHALMSGCPCQHHCTLCEATVKVDQLCTLKSLGDGVWGEVLWKVGGTGSVDAGSGATCVKHGSMLGLSVPCC